MEWLREGLGSLLFAHKEVHSERYYLSQKVQPIFAMVSATLHPLGGAAKTYSEEFARVGEPSRQAAIPLLFAPYDLSE